MKIILISAALATFISGMASARVVDVSPNAPSHKAGAVTEHNVARLEPPARERGVLCATRYVTTKFGDGSSATRKSVNCEE
jgi:hypothetical protein